MNGERETQIPVRETFVSFGSFAEGIPSGVAIE